MSTIPKKSIHYQSNQNPPSSVQPHPENNEHVDESLITEDTDIEEVELLKYTDSKNLYLTKVGLVFCFYYLIACIVLSMIYINKDGFRQKYFKYRIFSNTWTFL